MAKSTVPAYNTDRTDFTWSWSDTNDKVGVLVKSDDPPSEHSVASVFIDLTTAGGANTITVKCQLAFRLNGSISYGPEKTIKDENGDDLTFSSASPTNVVGNIYAQDWYAANDGFRIIMSGNTGGDSLVGTAAVVIR